MNKLKISLVASSLVLVGGLGSAVLWNGVANGEWDLPGLQQQVQHVTEVTDNHEGRITNLENKTNTPSDQPTPTPVVVTKVVTQAAPAATPTAQGVQTTPMVVSPSPTSIQPYILSWIKIVKQDCNDTTSTHYIVLWSNGSSTSQDNQPTTGLDETGDTSSTICVPH